MTEKIEVLLPQIGLWFMYISIAATILVRVAAWIAKLTPKTSDDEQVAKAKAVIDKATQGFLSLMSFLPTLGKNPQTKQMEKQLKELQKETADEPKAAS